MRQTTFVGIAGDGSPDGHPVNAFDARSTYQVQYPHKGLESTVTAGTFFGNIEEEVFSGRWRVVYDYEGEWQGRDWHEGLGIPLSIQIYGYSDGKFEELINTYHLAEIVPNHPVYVDEGGNRKTIPATYFSVGGLVDQLPK